MKIAFSGPQSSGKTTIVNAIDDHLCNAAHFTPRYKDHWVVASPTRSRTTPINDQGDCYDATQRSIIEYHVEQVNKPDDDDTLLVYDRCILDGLVYTTYLHEHGKVNDDTLQYARTEYFKYINEYDFIFITDPTDVPLVSDEVRSTSTEFRDNIFNIFKEFINDHELKNVHWLAGGTPVRLGSVRDVIDLYSPKKLK